MDEGAARLPLVQELGMHLSFRRDTGSWAQLATEGALLADLCCAHGCYTPTQHRGATQPLGSVVSCRTRALVSWVTSAWSSQQLCQPSLLFPGARLRRPPSLEPVLVWCLLPAGGQDFETPARGLRPKHLPGWNSGVPEPHCRGGHRNSWHRRHSRPPRAAREAGLLQGEEECSPGTQAAS